MHLNDRLLQATEKIMWQRNIQGHIHHIHDLVPEAHLVRISSLQV